MKTTPPKPPPLKPGEFTLPKNGHSLKAYFIGQALNGFCAQDEFRDELPENLVARAYEVGELMFETYMENNLSAVRRFNKKVL